MYNYSKTYVDHGPVGCKGLIVCLIAGWRTGCKTAPLCLSNLGGKLRQFPYGDATKFKRVLFMSDPTDLRRNTGPECQTMTDVRYEVDRLDRALVKLIAERQSYMDAAARIKGDRDTVRDPARIEDVVSKVLAEAKRQGLSASIAEPVWRTMIEQCIQHEFRIWDALRDDNDAKRAEG